MPKPTLCMIFESVTARSAIAKIAMAGVRAALDAGWRVTVAAAEVDNSLLGDVEWVRFRAFRRGFALKWLTARHFIRASLGCRRFDVTHAHQPQVADLADVFQCHYLTRVAYEQRCLTEGSGVWGWARKAQHYPVLRAEDAYYRRWNPGTHMLFNSELTRRCFRRLYGSPPLEQVLVYPFPALHLASEAERRQARAALVGDHPGPVVGYLGGLQERKGYRRLLRALACDARLPACPASGQPFLLMGGSHAEGFDVPELAGRFRSVGSVSDTDTFYAACDVLAVPSHFEPLGLVAFEAIARGTPVIATDEVGALPHLLEYGAGERWDPSQPMTPLVRRMAERRGTYAAAASKMAVDLGQDRYSRQLLTVYEGVLGRVGRRRRLLYPSGI